MSHKILAIIQLCKSKLALKLNKPEMWILELTKVFIHEFHFDYIKNKYNNKSTLLLTDTDRLLYEIKTENVYDDFSRTKKCLILVIIRLSQNMMMSQKNLVIEK